MNILLIKFDKFIISLGQWNCLLKHCILFLYVWWYWDKNFLELLFYHTNMISVSSNVMIIQRLKQVWVYTMSAIVKIPNSLPTWHSLNAAWTQRNAKTFWRWEHCKSICLICASIGRYHLTRALERLSVRAQNTSRQQTCKVCSGAKIQKFESQMLQFSNQCDA